MVWIRSDYKTIYVHRDGGFAHKTVVFYAYPSQPTISVGISYLTDTSNAVAIRHRACRWLSRYKALIALKLWDQLHVKRNTQAGEPTMSSSRKSGIDGMGSHTSEPRKRTIPPEGRGNLEARSVKRRLGPFERPMSDRPSWNESVKNQNWKQE